MTKNEVIDYCNNKTKSVTNFPSLKGENLVHIKR